MGADSRDEAKYHLRLTLTVDGVDVAFDHQWLQEEDRWKELVFALLTRVANVPEVEMRDLTNDMADLDLLKIPALADICKGRRGSDLGNTNARRILELLEERGLSRDEAQRGLTTICEAALSFQENYGGKVQRYLRNYGELMLRDLRQFRFSALKDTDVQYAFTFWLQNVLNMPLSLLDANVQEFCRQHSINAQDLIAAADELDLNLALVDDLVQRYLTKQKAVKDKR